INEGTECTPKALSHRIAVLKNMAGKIQNSNTPPATPRKRSSTKASTQTPKSSPKKGLKRERDPDLYDLDPVPILDFKRPRRLTAKAKYHYPSDEEDSSDFHFDPEVKSPAPKQEPDDEDVS